jgi:tetratricopeptide (TPR) repeat protein
MIHKSIFNLTMIGMLVAGSFAQAKPLDAELVMGNGRTWKGQLISRDGDWITIKTTTSPKPVRIGASTIKELLFKINLDTDKIEEMVAERQYDVVIKALTSAIEPYTVYADIPSNLTKYNVVLMELYYRTKQYDDSLRMATEIAADDRDPILQKKSRIYQVLSLIDGGKSAEAQALLKKYGWDRDLSAESAPEQLYLSAKLKALNKEYSQAMELVAKVIAFNSQDLEWMQPAEMLCAELYTELGMLDSADEVCRQISLLYRNTEEFDKAEQLKIKIETLRAELALEEGLDSEEA